MAEKHGQQDTLVGPLTASLRVWADDPNVKTYQVHPDKFAEYFNDQVFLEWWPLIASEAALTAKTFDETYGYLTGATFNPPNGASAGVLQNVTPDGTFPHMWASVEVTYPDANRKMTATFAYTALGRLDANSPTFAFSNIT